MGISFAELLLDETPDALFALSLDGKVLSWNRGAETLFGFSAQEALAQPIDALITGPAQLAESRRAFDTAVREGSAHCEGLRHRKDGSELHVDASFKLTSAPSGDVFIAAMLRDVTLQKSQHSEFISSLSHSLRSPLNAVIGFSEIMYRGGVGPMAANHREYLGDILASAKHLLQLINDLHRTPPNRHRDEQR